MTSSSSWITLFTLSFFFVALVNCRRKLDFSIPGPRTLRDRIAIVGAGPAGIHMALMLKRKGFKDVTILEKTGTLGGKSWTIDYRGAANEMGTVYLQPDYNDTIVPLVKKYLPPGDLANLPAASIWFNADKDNHNGGDGTRFQRPALDFQTYIGRFGASYLKTSNSTLILMSYLKAIEDYNRKHEELLGKYDGEVRPEPTKKVIIINARLHFNFRHRGQFFFSIFFLPPLSLI